MFRKKNSVRNTAWIFIFRRPQKIAITMMFVFFPIDLIYVDENNKIVEIKKSLKPFNDYFPKERAITVIELEEGTIDKKKIVVGQKVNW